MKVVCAGCSTKYSIEDDKVVGKTFKVRCRACGLSVVVRGEASAAGTAAAAGGAPVGGGPVWHAVQGGRQIGPFDSGEILRRRTAGELDDGSYVWREGFADWLPLGDVDELRAGVAIAIGPAASPAAPAVALAVFPAPAPVPAASAAPGVAHTAAEGSRLHGERRESSLLFSLDNLAKAAAPAPARARAGGAGGEGSGLIDIRSLARAYEPVARATDAARTSPAAGIGSVEDLPVFPAASFISPSVLIPQAPRRDRRLVVGLAAAGGLIAICATLLIVIAFTRGGRVASPEAARSPEAQRFAKNDPPAAERGASPTVVEPPAVPRTEPAVPRTEPPAPPAPQARTPTPQVRTPSPTPQVRTPSPTPQVRTPSPTPQVRTPSPPAPPAPPAGPQCDQVTCVVNGYDSECCRALRGGNPLSGPTTPSPSSSDLPENLDRAAITTGLATISAQRCGGASAATGMVKAQLKVSPAGTVTAVNVQSSPDAALSACIVEQGLKGRFKATQRGGTFSYVWRF
jgi:predicted Zn finger-like uncharacterized protein